MDMYITAQCLKNVQPDSFHGDDVVSNIELRICLTLDLIHRNSRSQLRQSQLALLSVDLEDALQ